MARIPPVTRERVREDLRSIFDEVSSGPGGVGTGPMSVLKYSLEISRRAIPLFNYVRNESILPQKVHELAMLTTARAKDCPYIWNAHAALGRRAGLRDPWSTPCGTASRCRRWGLRKPWSSS
jgi:AhpD family alkylhydroperoxidase